VPWLSAAGRLALHQGDNAAAGHCLEASLALSHQLGDQAGIARTRNNLGLLRTRQGDYVAGRHLLSRISPTSAARAARGLIEML
jgi:hypothetical protein